MELLKRFEDESSDLPTDSNDGEGGEDINDLAQRLASFDLGSFFVRTSSWETEGAYNHIFARICVC